MKCEAFIFLICNLIPLITIYLLFFTHSKNIEELRNLGLQGSVFILVLLIILQFFLDFDSEQSVIFFNYEFSELFNLNYSVSLDGLSYFLIILTAFLNVICILLIWEIKNKLKEFLIILFFIEFLLINVFATLDIIFFYIFFEGILIPMFIMILLWGGRTRKIKAAYNFFVYTFLGSVIMLLGIIYIYCVIGSTNLYGLLHFHLEENLQILLWLSFFISFAIKVPMWPVHLWLPEAHTEAPTAGSVLLAGVLLKLGTYGMLRFMLPVFGFASIYFTPFIYTVSIIAIIYTSLSALRQIDLKKAIAYSSVAHMNLVTIGLFTNMISGIKGAIFLMLSHGVVSSALFILIGILYDRYHTRNIKYYSGVVLIMPTFISVFLIQILSNMGFPGTSGFIGEFLILLFAYKNNIIMSIAATTGVVVAAAYSIWLLNRIAFGPFKNLHMKFYSDLNEREFAILFILTALTLILGMYPNIILNILDYTLLRILI